MFRKMRKHGQQASEDECIEILDKAKRGTLAVLGDDDYPYTVPFDYVYDDGHIYFHCAKEGHKLDAVRRHDKVSFCVLSDGRLEDNDWWYHFTSVIVFGRIREIIDEAEKDRRLRQLGNKYFPTEQHLEKEMNEAASRAVVLDLEIEHMTGKHIREK